MRLLSNDEKVVELAVIYLRIIIITFIPTMMTSVFSGTLRATENVKMPLIANCAGIAANIFLNYVLIFGHFGFRAYGIKGAAVATLIARIVEFGILFVYIAFFEQTVKITIKKMFSVHIFIIKDFFKYSIPVILNEAIWGFGVSIHTGIIGQISKEQFAAYTISNMIERISHLSMIGFSSTACILIGRAIGQGKDKDEVAGYARTFQGLAGVFALLSAAVIFLIRTPVINIFDIGGVTKYYADKLILLVSALAIFKTFNCMSVVGIFRGGGDTKTGMVVDFAAMYCVAIPLGALIKFGFNLNVPFVYAFLVSDELVKVPIYFAYIKSRRWIKNITREF
jgi:putative MATE family efflux protein